MASIWFFKNRRNITMPLSVVPRCSSECLATTPWLTMASRSPGEARCSAKTYRVALVQKPTRRLTREAQALAAMVTSMARIIRGRGR